MSCSRENVTWQSKDGTWNVGHFDFYATGDQSDPEWDYEWDVEYVFERFHWVSRGHATPVQACAAWRGANPGGTVEVEYNAENAAEIAQYERMAQPENVGKALV